MPLADWHATTAGKHLATVGKGYRTDGKAPFTVFQLPEGIVI
ncbi:MAG: hypothetical protein ACI3XF_01195 [Eubacteriales bacterium]